MAIGNSSDIFPFFVNKFTFGIFIPDNIAVFINDIAVFIKVADNISLIVNHDLQLGFAVILQVIGPGDDFFIFGKDFAIFINGSQFLVLGIHQFSVETKRTDNTAGIVTDIITAQSAADYRAVIIDQKAFMDFT